MELRELLNKRFLILDGGMGTLLQKEGLKSGEKPEKWNLTHPEIIKNIHKNYFNSGSNVVNTNTFGANLINYNEKELENIIFAAIENAQKAKEESTFKSEKFISLDIGPLGKLLKPLGELDFLKAVDIFAKTVSLGYKYGVDLITVETMNDTLETKAALLAVKENSDLPVFVTNAYSENGNLLTGASPKAVIALLEGMGADAIGVNCSMGPEALLPIVEQYSKYSSLPLIFKPNAGMPYSENGVTKFNVSAKEFAKSILKAADLGLSIFGGCCGTTPEYIKLVSEEINGNNGKNVIFKPNTVKNTTVISSYSKAVDFNEQPVLIGERINPTGKKRFKQALIENDINYILAEGIKQQECNVHALDVNVGLPEIDETEVLPNAVYELQAVTDLPLQIDTSNIKAMEKALRIYNGKALINSVNGKRESMEQVFPLVKKYGGVVVCLTLDENGIPKTVQGRVNIAKKIIDTAAKYGISKNNLLFDTLAMAVSAEPDAAGVTLGALKEIKENLKAHTTLGVSNISFGLPKRSAVNAAFFTLALYNGLSAAIINPFSDDILKAYYSFLALNNKDENFNNYISFMTDLEKKEKEAEALKANTNFISAESDISQNANKQSVNGNEKNQSKSGNKEAANVNLNKDDIALKEAIIKGLKEIAFNKTKQELTVKEPLEIINNIIIPALDTVGQKYEKGEAYLPQLLMSAEAAKFAFEQIKQNALNKNANGPDGKNSETKKCKIILATVEGDIHDIGKNIVKLLLENYGFEVFDLGKDVPAEDIVKKAMEENAPIVGLSALMTTTVPSMEKTIKLLNQKLPNCKTLVGGAVLTEEYAKSIKADKYAKDAMEAVRYADEINSSL